MPTGWKNLKMVLQWWALDAIFQAVSPMIWESFSFLLFLVFLNILLTNFDFIGFNLSLKKCVKINVKENKN